MLVYVYVCIYTATSSACYEFLRKVCPWQGPALNASALFFAGSSVRVLANIKRMIAIACSG